MSTQSKQIFKETFKGVTGKGGSDDTFGGHSSIGNLSLKKCKTDQEWKVTQATGGKHCIKLGSSEIWSNEP